MTYKREGQCVSCGECCKSMRITAHLSNILAQHRTLEEAKNYYSYRNITIVGTDEKQNKAFLELNQPCNQLDKNSMCKLHNNPAEKPFVCHIYPTEPDGISSCGYHFSRLK